MRLAATLELTVLRSVAGLPDCPCRSVAVAWILSELLRMIGSDVVPVTHLSSVNWSANFGCNFVQGCQWCLGMEELKNDLIRRLLLMLLRYQRNNAPRNRRPRSPDLFG